MLLLVERRMLDADERHPKVREDLSPRRQISVLMIIFVLYYALSYHLTVFSL